MLNGKANVSASMLLYSATVVYSVYSSYSVYSVVYSVINFNSANTLVHYSVTTVSNDYSN